MATQMHQPVVPLLALACAASMLLWVEFEAVRVSENLIGKHDRFSGNGQFRQPFSLQGVQGILLACDKTMSVETTAFQTTKYLQNRAQSCATFAYRTTQIMPTHGAAYLIAAQAADVAHNTLLADRNLALSLEFAPFEGWLAQRRFVLASSKTVWRGYSVEDDIVTLLSTQSGSELLAEYFARRPKMRARISQSLIQASAQQKTRFANLLRKATQ